MRKVTFLVVFSILLVVSSVCLSIFPAAATPKLASEITCEVSPSKKVKSGAGVWISGRLTDASTGEGLERKIRVAYSVDDGKTWEELMITPPALPIAQRYVETNATGHYATPSWVPPGHIPHDYLIRVYWEGDDTYEPAESPVQRLTVGLPSEVPVEIVSSRSYTNYWYEVVGEVRNEGTENLESVKVAVVYYDAAGEIMRTVFEGLGGKYSLGPPETILIPGQKSPFYSACVKDQVASHKIVVSYFLTTDKVPYRKFSVHHEGHKLEDGRYRVTGEVENVGDRDASSVEVVATFYGEDELVVASVSSRMDPRDLAPGQTAPFEITLDEEESARVKKYVLQVQCRESYKPSTISCEISKSVITIGQDIAVSGSIPRYPLYSTITVTLTYTRPDGSSFTRNVTYSRGKFEDVYAPDAVGSWSVEASWEGDQKYLGATSPPTSFEVKEKGCIIATATYGSELAPEVQFLRGFRDQTVLSTFAGSQFMAAFNAWYYSFSPSVASYLSNHGLARGIVKLILYPLIGILHLSASVYSVLNFSPELGILMAWFTASSLTGVVYFSLPVMVLQTSVKRLRGLRTSQLRWFVLAWFASAMLILAAEILTSPPVMMCGTVSFVLLTLALSALVVSNQVVKRIVRV